MRWSHLTQLFKDIFVVSVLNGTSGYDNQEEIGLTKVRTTKLRAVYRVKVALDFCLKFRTTWKVQLILLLVCFCFLPKFCVCVAVQGSCCLSLIVSFVNVSFFMVSKETTSQSMSNNIFSMIILLIHCFIGFFRSIE